MLLALMSLASIVLPPPCGHTDTINCSGDMIGTREHACHVVVVGAEEYCEEGVGRVALGEGSFVGQVGGEEGGDGVKDVGQCPGLGGVACPAVLAGYAGRILAQPTLPDIPR